VGKPLNGDAAQQLGLVTAALDDIDWEDEIRIAIEERAAMSPDALTGLEANLRFASQENMVTRIFGRLSAWQNWIFNRPNAVGEKGAEALRHRTESRLRFQQGMRISLSPAFAVSQRATTRLHESAKHHRRLP
jgi:hypothetical protein